MLDSPKILVLASLLALTSCAKRSSAPDEPVDASEAEATRESPSAKFPSSSSSSSSGPGLREPGSATEFEPEPDPGPGPGPDPDPEKRGISATIRRNIPALQRCYQDELHDDQTLAGRMNYTITIETDGSVSEVVIDFDTVESEAVRDCVVEIMRTWSFADVVVDEPTEVSFAVRFAAV